MGFKAVVASAAAAFLFFGVRFARSERMIRCRDGVIRFDVRDASWFPPEAPLPLSPEESMPRPIAACRSDVDHSFCCEMLAAAALSSGCGPAKRTAQGTRRESPNVSHAADVIEARSFAASFVRSPRSRRSRLGCSIDSVAYQAFRKGTGGWPHFRTMPRISGAFTGIIRVPAHRGAPSSR